MPTQFFGFGIIKMPGNPLNNIAFSTASIKKMTYTKMNHPQLANLNPGWFIDGDCQLICLNR